MLVKYGWVGRGRGFDRILRVPRAIGESIYGLKLAPHSEVDTCIVDVPIYILFMER